jgi:hypothetical protein
MKIIQLIDDDISLEKHKIVIYKADYCPSTAHTIKMNGVEIYKTTYGEGSVALREALKRRESRDRDKMIKKLMKI